MLASRIFHTCSEPQPALFDGRIRVHGHETALRSIETQIAPTKNETNSFCRSSQHKHMGVCVCKGWFFLVCLATIECFLINHLQLSSSRPVAHNSTIRLGSHRTPGWFCVIIRGFQLATFFPFGGDAKSVWPKTIDARRDELIPSQSPFVSSKLTVLLMHVRQTPQTRLIKRQAWL